VTSELRGYLDLQDDEDLAREVGYYVLRKMDGGSYERLSPPEQVIACLTEVEMEVNNGGFDQYYRNSPGEHAREAVAALEELGAGHTAALLKDANAVFGAEGPDPDRDKRGAQMDRLPQEARDKWSDLDGAFYEYKDNLSQLAAQYIRRHRDFFTD
jgi:hypothetical protein